MFENADSIFIWAQIIGFCAMVIGTLAMQFKNPRHILLGNVPSAGLWTIQYLMLGAPLGAILNISSALKDGTVAFIHKRYLNLVIGSFLIMTWLIGLYHFNQWYDLLPLLAGTAVNAALLIDRDNRPLFVRAVIVNCALWIVYNLIVGSWMGATCAIMIIGSSMLSMARYEGWEIGKCYRSFVPSIARSLFIFQGPRTYP